MKISQEQEVLLKYLQYNDKEILAITNLINDKVDRINKPLGDLLDGQAYNQERFKYLLTDTKQITQYLQEYRREILVAQAANAPMENDISKVTDDSVDLSDGVTAFPMHDNLKVQIDDGPAVPVHVTQNIPDDNALPQA